MDYITAWDKLSEFPEKQKYGTAYDYIYEPLVG